MAMRTFDAPPPSTGGALLEHGWHVVRITDPKVTMDNGKRRLVCTVVSVSPNSAGQRLTNVKFLIDHDVYGALGYAAKFPSHDDEDSDAICAAADGRVFRVECKPDRNNARFREIGWPQRPSDEDLAACAPHMAPPKPAEKPPEYPDDDEIPF